MEETVAPKLSRNIPGAPGSVSVAEGVRRRMRRSRGSLSPRQGWPGLSSLGNQLDFSCTSHPARPAATGATASPSFPNGCSLSLSLSLSAVWLAVTSPRRTAAATRGAEIAVAPDNPQDGVSPLFTAYRLMTGNPLLPSYNRNRRLDAAILRRYRYLDYRNIGGPSAFLAFPLPSSFPLRPS